MEKTLETREKTELYKEALVAFKQKHPKGECEEKIPPGSTQEYAAVHKLARDHNRKAAHDPLLIKMYDEAFPTQGPTEEEISKALEVFKKLFPAGVQSGGLGKNQPRLVGELFKFARDTGAKGKHREWVKKAYQERFLKDGAPLEEE